MNTLSLSQIREQVEAIRSRKNLLPFAPDVLAFCDILSQRLTRDPALRQWPDLVALGFWLRPAHLKQLQQQANQQNALLIPAGLVLHITPGNVDSLFAYSWLLSLLAGNHNLIRLSNKAGAVQKVLLETIHSLLRQPRFERIRQQNYFFQTTHENKITAFLSSACDIRVIWGGDASIAHIRGFSLPPASREVVFADRFSFALIQADRLLTEQKIDADQTLHQLCERFYRDVFTFGQQACSSPRLLIWLGDKAQTRKAAALFWQAMRGQLHAKKQTQGAAVMNKLVHCQQMALRGNSVDTALAPELYRVWINSPDHFLWKQHCGEGLLYETAITDLTELDEWLPGNTQTCVYYGISRDLLRQQALQGKFSRVLRFVPVGQALTFDIIWDGMDLLHAFGRQMLIR